MNKQEIIAFFDRMAPQWDGDMIRSDEIINRILDGAEMTQGKHVLDVACGTGVLFPDYLKRQAASVTAIDISPEMVKIAAAKYPEAPIQVLCGDVETAAFDRKFDCIVVYNAFPHFPDPQNLIKTLAGLLVPGGTLTVAHGMSREAIDHHHEGAAKKVSCGLMPHTELMRIFEKYLKVTVAVSDHRMYQVTGKKEIPGGTT